MTLLVSGIMLISHLYLGWRLTVATPKNRRRKWIRWLPVLLLLSFYTLPVTGYIAANFYGDIDVFDLPKPITYWFWFGLIFSFQLATWLLLLDAFKIGAHWFSSWPATKINLYFRRTVGMLGIVVFLFTGIKMYADTTNIQVEEEIIEMDDLPNAFHNFKIIHISDVQGDQYTGAERIARYVEKVNSQDADIVIFTGDLVTNGTDYLEMAAGEMAKVESRLGTYAVVGDHDYWAGLSEVEPALENQGIELLRDENTIIPAGSDSLLLTGVIEVYSQSAEKQVVDSLTAQGESEELFKIMASHQVSDLVIGKAQEYNYPILLAGHTHGGQVRVPFLGMQFSAADRETKYVSGSYWAEELFVNVNNGLGFTLAPVRYNAPPKISVITLRAV